MSGRDVRERGCQGEMSGRCDVREKGVREKGVTGTCDVWEGGVDRERV